jgi:uncharacterized protein (TIGR02444 family)
MLPPQPACIDASLWAFSTSLYGLPGAAEECLLLQEHFGVNINVLLFSLYAASEFRAVLSPIDIGSAASAIAQWHTQVVETLRKVRRLLKQPGTRGASLRTQVAHAELEAERIESASLIEWFNARSAALPQGERNAAIAHNCRSTLSHYGAGPQIDLPQRLIGLAIAAVKR